MTSIAIIGLVLAVLLVGCLAFFAACRNSDRELADHYGSGAAYDDSDEDRS